MDAHTRRIPTPWLLVIAALLIAGFGLGSQDAWAQVRQYRIDPSSTVRVLVYRRGMLSVLAHDHVMLAKEVTGRLSLDAGDLTRSSLSLRVNAAAFDVDAPAEREKVGFLSELTAGNRQSIQAAMIGPQVLDVAKFPTIAAESERVTGRQPDLTVEMRVKIRDREQVVKVPAKVVVALDHVQASGS